jgi:hypothetical protein
MWNRTSLLIIFLLLISSFSVGACGANAGTDRATLAMAEAHDIPTAVQDASQRVSDAYRFAAANPTVLEQIPCYCGCGPMGHGSNYACFWQSEGTVDEHALGCGICVDIAQDVMRGLQQGRSLSQIRIQVDGDYSRFGPATDTPPVAQIEG